MTKYTCCIADSACVAAANHPTRHRPLPKCHGCGQDVCVKCSSLRQYRGDRRRLCNDCQIERLDGGDDTRIMTRLNQLVNPRTKAKRNRP